MEFSNLDELYQNISMIEPQVTIVVVPHERFSYTSESLESIYQCTKWNLTKQDNYFQKRDRHIGQRRHKAFLRPLVHQLSFGGYASWLEKVLIGMERKVNHYIRDRHHQVVENRVVVELKQLPSSDSIFDNCDRSRSQDSFK